MPFNRQSRLWVDDAFLNLKIATKLIVPFFDTPNVHHLISGMEFSPFFPIVIVPNVAGTCWETSSLHQRLMWRLARRLPAHWLVAAHPDHHLRQLFHMSFKSKMKLPKRARYYRSIVVNTLFWDVFGGYMNLGNTHVQYMIGRVSVHMGIKSYEYVSIYV